MKRCFIAVEIPSDIALLKFYQQLRTDFKNSSINWVKVENMHLTLSFAGEITEEQIDAATVLLNKIKLGYSSFDCELKGFGSFGKSSNPSVLWIGINASPLLFKIQKHIEDELKASAFRLDARSFNPHLTLGRIKYFRDEKELEHYSHQFKDYSFLKFSVNSIVLFESKLSAAGPVYTSIGEFTLAG